GLPTDSSLRSASVFDGAPQIKSQSKSDSLRIVDTLVCIPFFASSLTTIAGKPSSHRKTHTLQRFGRLLGRRALLLIVILILGAPLNTLAGIRQGFGG
ncbi:hypothetical protein ACW9I5_34640, partial [Pseudomonas azotoformans]